MKITVFTSNQPRHIHLINRLASIADEVYAVQECNTVFPGNVKDFFDNSEIMRKYFSEVMDAEHEVFGTVSFIAENVRTLSLKAGDLNLLPLDALHPALQSDYFVVFGASYIKGELIDKLVDRQAINIHMGVSPYYRGSSCNFWALYDRNPEYVGATIHMLSRGLDSGDMLYHAFPHPDAYKPFELGMYAVKAAHDSLIARIQSREIFTFPKMVQDKGLEIRYTKNRDFDDTVAEAYLQDLPSPAFIVERT